MLFGSIWLRAIWTRIRRCYRRGSVAGYVVAHRPEGVSRCQDRRCDSRLQITEIYYSAGLWKQMRLHHPPRRPQVASRFRYWRRTRAFGLPGSPGYHTIKAAVRLRVSILPGLSSHMTVQPSKRSPSFIKVKAFFSARLKKLDNAVLYCRHISNCALQEETFQRSLSGTMMDPAAQPGKVTVCSPYFKFQSTLGDAGP